MSNYIYLSMVIDNSDATNTVTFRDILALAAMRNILPGLNFNAHDNIKSAAKWAYVLADEMVKARKVR
jgi:hypothetical protein